VTRLTLLAPEFVEYVPPDLSDGVLYISIPYRTAVHRCACGCGNKVVTPISPADWQLFYDGDAVSLTPSIGNWGFPCRSHYWIDANEVQWSGDWTDKQIARGRARDDRDRAMYLAGRTATAAPSPSPQPLDSDCRTPRAKPASPSWLARLLTRLSLHQGDR
jgi:hypothetical protein